MFFYFDFANYFKMIRLAWNEKVPRARNYYLAVLLVAVPIVSTFHAICFFLDWFLFPDLKRVEVKAPVFMVGHARSGTTLTHRLLSKDAGRFSSFNLYELYFPSLLQKKIIRAIMAYDARHWRGLLEGQVRAWEDWRYGRMRHMHSMGLTEPEEDDICLYYSMGAGFWITKMPYMGDLDFYHMNDWDPKKRKRYNDMYRECVRRQLYLNGPDKTHLSKNPMFSGRVASLIEAFPDARFIVNMRDPNSTIPSMLKLVQAGWSQLGWDAERQARCLKILADQSWSTYLHPLEALEANPDVPAAVIDYRDLTSDPAATIERVYTDLGWEMSDDYREELAGEGKKARKHETRHTYSLAEFGLDEEAIRRELAVLFDRFQWDADNAAPPSATSPAASDSEAPVPSTPVTGEGETPDGR